MPDLLPPTQPVKKPMTGGNITRAWDLAKSSEFRKTFINADLKYSEC
jgi:hypothetical protein